VAAGELVLWRESCFVWDLFFNFLCRRRGVMYVDLSVISVLWCD